MRYIINRQLLITVLALSLALSFFGALPSARAQQTRGIANGPTIKTPNVADSSHALRDDAKAYLAEVERRLAAEQRTIDPGSEDTTLTAPANDNLTNAPLLTGVSGNINATNVEATGEPGEPNHAGGSSPLNSVWYSWVAPSNLSMTFETSPGTLTDTTMAVYTGSAVDALTLIVANDEFGINANSGTPSRVTFIANSGTIYKIAVDGFASATGTFNLNYRINAAETFKQFNYDGDTVSDVGVYRPSNRTWYIRMGTGVMLAATFGQEGDILHAGDFDGDGKTDIAVWRPSNGMFYVRKSSNGVLLAEHWGQTGDVPVQGDFDGDDISDFAVWRPSNGTFYVLSSVDRSLMVQQFGFAGDTVAPGDYDGDGKTDFAIRRDAHDGAVFYILRSSDGQLRGPVFGFASDLIIPGDYDLDGISDVAVYRRSSRVFYARRSSDGGLITVRWGSPEDQPVPGDYLGGFASDIMVFRPSEGKFYGCSSLSEHLLVIQWGMSGDIPVASSSVH